MNETEFSEMCKQLIKNNNTSVYQISKRTGIERTALNRMVNGKRLLKQEDFKLFCDSLRMEKKGQRKIK